MRVPSIAAALLAAAALAPAAEPTARGTFTLGGEPMTIMDAIAHRRTDWEGPKIVVTLLGKPVDRSTLAGALDVEGVVDAARDAAEWSVELEFKEDGSWTQERHAVKSGNSSTSGMKYDPAHAGTMKASIREGHVRGRVRADFDEGHRIDVTLAVPITEPPAGTALAADGGAPGKALRACNDGYRKKSLAEVKRWCSGTFADVIDSALRMRAEGMEWDDPWGKKDATGHCEVGTLDALALSEGIATADQARFSARGGWTQDGEPRTCVGKVFLRQEDGRWRVTSSRLDVANE